MIVATACPVRYRTIGQLFPVRRVHGASAKCSSDSIQTVIKPSRRLGYSPYVAETPPPTTEQVSVAAGSSLDTVRRWARLGLLPTPTKVYRGRRGIALVWARHAPRQAAWVKRQLDAGRTISEVKTALERGEFRPPP